MILQAHLFVEGQKVEQFTDSQITINLAVQNITDISKVFSDYTQSFTIPCSPINNAIFQHFYENDVDKRFNQILDYNLKRPAYIELDTYTFRTGKCILEKCNLKNNRPESYTITFYTELTSFKDIIGELKLSDLDYSSLILDYKFGEIYDSITTDDSVNNRDVRWPLISSERLWNMGNINDPTNDISNPTYAIDYRELFPALRIIKIMELIMNQFAITFTGTFLTNPFIQEIWIWYKNKSSVTTVGSVSYNLDFDKGERYQPSPMQTFGDNTNWENVNIYDEPFIFSSTQTNSIRIVYTYALWQENTTINGYQETIDRDAGLHRFQIVLNVSAPTDVTYLEVYINGSLSVTNTYTGSGTFEVYQEQAAGQTSLDKTFTFKISSLLPTQIDGYIKYHTDLSAFNNFGFYNQNRLFFTTINTSASLNINGYAPDVKIIDFIQGLVKAFNLTIIAKSEDTFQLETLENWYQQGRIIDITEYTDTQTINIDRIKLFKNIDFKHQNSASITNVGFGQNFYKQFGDLVAAYLYDGGVYKIESPFEDLLPTRLEDDATNPPNLRTCVSYAVDINKNPYVPKMCILYKAPLTDSKAFMTDGSSDLQLGKYLPFTPDSNINNIYVSLNYGVEQSPLYDYTNMYNSLYSVYYQGYISNLFNRKNRRTSVKALLPLKIIQDLALNDRLVIRDKRYIISDIKLNLSTGLADLVLINDFRDVTYRGIVQGGGKGKGDKVVKVKLYIPVINGAVKTELRLETVGKVRYMYIFPQSKDTRLTITETQWVDVETNDIVSSKDTLSQFQLYISDIDEDGNNTEREIIFYNYQIEQDE